LKSWDSFQIPMPFTRVAFCYGVPLHVPRSASEKDLEAIRMEVEVTLEAATREAERAVGLGGHESEKRRIGFEREEVRKSGS